MNLFKFDKKKFAMMTHQGNPRTDVQYILGGGGGGVISSDERKNLIKGDFSHL